MNVTLVTSILGASVPTLILLLSIVLNRSDYHRLRGEMQAGFDAVRAQQHTDMLRIDELFLQSRAQQQADMLRIYELFGEHAQRIARLEAQVQGR